MRCNKCGKIRRKFEKRYRICKECWRKMRHEYYLKNRDEWNKRGKENRLKRLDEVRRISREYARAHPKEAHRRYKRWYKINQERVREKARNAYLRMKKERLRERNYLSTQQRCLNPKHKNYKVYGGRGIKLLMSKEDFKTLWFRDKAYLMTRPSIDRKDRNGNYTIGNCRFIEYEDNKRSYSRRLK